MKAIILAAGIGSKLGELGKAVPKCLIEIGGKTLLERQIEILESCGIGKQDIIVVIGDRGEAWDSENKERIRKIHSNVVINEKNVETRNSYSLWLAIKEIAEDILCIDGDLLFNKQVIEKVIKSDYPSLLLTYNRNKFAVGNRVLMKKDRVLGIGPTINSDRVYVGFAKFNKDFVEVLKKELSSPDYYKESLDKPLYHLCIDNFIHNLNLEDDGEENLFLNGGSYAITRQIPIQSDEKFEGEQKVIRKEATEGREKLINEIQWMLDLPEDAKHRFPQILKYDLKSDPVYADFKYYPMKTLRKSLIEGEIKASSALKILENVFDFMFEKLYSKNIQIPDEDMAYNLYFKRMDDRFKEAEKKSPIFKEILGADRIVINGKVFPNLPEVVGKLKQNKKLLKLLNPPSINLIHGDLHFDNILIDQNDASNFILIDPRGKMYDGKVEGDYAYDLGKVWHSINGLYDFLHEDKFSLNVDIKNETVNAEFNITPYESLREYRNLYAHIPSLLYKYQRIKDDPYWDIRTSFNEVVHFCSMAPFHIKGDKKEKLAIAMYLRGIMLMDKFLDELVFHSVDPTVININTSQDYLEAKRLFGDKV